MQCVRGKAEGAARVTGMSYRYFCPHALYAYPSTDKIQSLINQ